MVKQYSILDAFKALDEVEEEVESKKALTESVVDESKVFDLRDSKEVDEAQQFLEDNERKEEAEIKVIDVDADSLEHVKNNEEYVGQYILKCNACHTPRFINAEDLVVSEDDPSIYNLESECPHCHAINCGYTMGGQVGKVESSFSNDAASADDEPSFEKEESAPEEVAPSIPTDDVEEFKDVEETPKDPDDVEADDTADMGSNFGDEFDFNDTAEDDTEEPSVKEEPEENDVDLTADEDKKNESLDEEPEDSDEDEEEEVPFVTTVTEFFENCLEPEKLEEIKVVRVTEDGEEEKLFEGKYEDIPEEMKSKDVVGFDCSGYEIPVNISDSDTKDYPFLVKDIISLIKSDSICLHENESDEDVFEGNPAEIGEEFFGRGVISIEPKSGLKLIVKDEVSEAIKESYEPTDAEGTLVKHILEANGMSFSNMKIYGTKEFWICEEVFGGIDGDEIYEKYILPTNNEDLRNEFKAVTGYVNEVLDLRYDAAKAVVEEVKPEENVKAVTESAEVVVTNANGLVLDKVEVPTEGEIHINTDAEIDESKEEADKATLSEGAADTIKDTISNVVSALEDISITPIEEDAVTTASSDDSVIEEEFDEVSFTETINEYLKNTCEDSVVFETLKGVKDDKSFMIEGNLVTEGLEVPTQFRLESLDEGSYKVTNTLSDEEFIVESVVADNKRTFSLKK